MKSLNEYIHEALEINEAKETMVRIKLDGDDKSSLQDKFITLAQKANIYGEKTDDGVKLKVKPGDNVDSIVSELEGCIEKCKSEDEEKHAACISSCESSIEKLKSAAEKEEEESKEEPKDGEGEE